MLNDLCFTDHNKCKDPHHEIICTCRVLWLSLQGPGHHLQLQSLPPVLSLPQGASLRSLGDSQGAKPLAASVMVNVNVNCDCDCDNAIVTVAVNVIVHFICD